MNKAEKQNDNYLYLLQPILDFLAIQDAPRKSDVIFVFGSAKHFVAEHAAELYLKGFAPLILISGHKTEQSNNLCGKTEADFMKGEVIKLGISETKIITEDKAANTLENVIFGMRALADKNIKIKSAILVAKPFHLRRCSATFKKQFPRVELYCSSPKMDFKKYLSYEIGKTENEVIKRIIEEISRLKIYAEKGDILKQKIPKKAETSAGKLKNVLKL